MSRGRMRGGVGQGMEVGAQWNETEGADEKQRENKEDSNKRQRRDKNGGR